MNDMASTTGAFPAGVALAGLLAVVVLVQMITFLKHYIRCPAGKVLVITGKTDNGEPRIVRSGAAFVWPLLQSHSFLDLAPFTVTVEVTHQGSRLHLEATVAVGSSAEGISLAVSRLLGRSQSEISDLAQQLLRGPLLQGVSAATPDDVETLPTRVRVATTPALEAIGLELISLSIGTRHGRTKT